MNMTRNQVAKFLGIAEKIANENKRFDAMQCALVFRSMFNEHVDWHEFVTILDYLRRHDFLRITKPGGHVEYGFVQSLTLRDILVISKILGREEN